MSYTNAAAQGATWTDEQAAVVVVDTGTNQPAVFFTSIPQSLDEGNVSTLVSSLQLNSTTTGQPGTATPTDGSQNGGNGDGSGGATRKRRTRDRLGLTRGGGLGGGWGGQGARMPVLRAAILETGT